MLRSMRDGAKSGFMKFILLGAMALAVGGLVLTDVGGFFRGGVSSNYVAKGKNIKIGITEFDRNLRRVLAQQRISPEDAYRFGLVTQALNNEIRLRIIAEESRRMGLVVGDDTVAEQVAELAETLATDGGSKKDAVKQVLRAQGISEDEFIRAIRQEISGNLFQSALLGGTTKISKAQAKALYQFNNEKRDFTYIALNNDSITDITEPTEENLQSYYESIKNEFMIPEKRSATIATLKKEMIEGNIDISNDELREVYADNIASYERPERRVIEQGILSSESDAKDVLKKIKAGKSVKAAVTEVSGKAGSYLGENDFAKRDLLEELAEPVYAASAGDLIDPIQSPLGWHVMKIKEIKPAGTEKFEDIKEALKEDILQERLLDELVEASNTMDDRLASGEELEGVVADMELTTEKFENFIIAGTTTDGKDLFKNYGAEKAEILETAFDFDVGESSPIIELEDGRYITVRVDNIVESSYKPYEDVKTALKTRWISEQKRAANKLRAEQSFAALNSGKDIAEITKETNAPKKSFNNMIRTGKAPEGLSESNQRKIFDADQGQAVMLQTKDGYIVGQVAAIKTASTDNVSDKDLEKIIEEESTGLRQEIIAQYINAMSLKYDIRINERLLQTLYGAPNGN